MKNVANATHYLNMDTKELFNLYNKNKNVKTIVNFDLAKLVFLLKVLFLK